jgi:hypothetical protein
MTPTQPFRSTLPYVAFLRHWKPAEIPLHKHSSTWESSLKSYLSKGRTKLLMYYNKHPILFYVGLMYPVIANTYLYIIISRYERYYN